MDKRQTQADGDIITALCSLPKIISEDGQDYVQLADVLETVRRYKPSVAIPPEHDGCKDCRYQYKSEDELPCCECQQNYKDKWESRPHWKKISPADIYECSECGQNVMTQDIDAYNFCHGCGCLMEIER